MIKMCLMKWSVVLYNGEEQTDAQPTPELNLSTSIAFQAHSNLLPDGNVCY